MRNSDSEDITANDLKIIANGSIRSFEAAYRNAEVYEIFADKYLNQQRNQNLSMPIKNLSKIKKLMMPQPDCMTKQWMNISKRWKIYR